MASRLTAARPALLLLLGLLALAACDAAPGAAAGPLDLAAEWVTSSPEAVGMDPAAVAQAADRMEAIPRARSLLVVHGGRLVVERSFHGAGRETLHDVRSVTKSVVGLLAGAAIDRGHLAPDTRVADVLAGRPGLRPEHGALTVGHLLTMTGGFEWNELSGDDYARWVLSEDPIRFLLDRPLATPPGAAFRYNSAAVHLLGVVIAEAVGEPLPAFAASALFHPLGITEAAWEPSPGGHVNGGAGLDLRARDLARLGQLVLQGGVSGERAVVPRTWVDSMRAPSQPWRVASGVLTATTYGRLWWVAEGPIQAAYALGYGGQLVVVAPAHDLVVVATTDWRGLSAEPGGATAVEAAVMEVAVALVAAAR